MGAEWPLYPPPPYQIYKLAPLTSPRQEKRETATGTKRERKPRFLRRRPLYFFAFRAGTFLAGGAAFFAGAGFLAGDFLAAAAGFLAAGAAFFPGMSLADVLAALAGRVVREGVAGAFVLAAGFGLAAAAFAFGLAAAGLALGLAAG